MRLVPLFPRWSLRLESAVSTAKAFEVNRAHLLPILGSHLIDVAIHLVVLKNPENPVI
jgi:hypothetical protein